MKKGLIAFSIIVGVLLVVGILLQALGYINSPFFNWFIDVKQL